MRRLRRLRVGCFIFLGGTFDGLPTRDLAKCWICYLESRSHWLVKISMLTNTLSFNNCSCIQACPRVALFGSCSSLVHISTLMILYLLFSNDYFLAKRLSFRSIRYHGIQYWLGLRSSAYRCFAKRLINAVSPSNHSRGWVNREKQENQFCYLSCHTVMSWYILSIC